MSETGSVVRSRCFGYNAPRIVIIAVLLAITAYFWWVQDPIVWFMVVISLAIIFLNVGVRIDSRGMQVSVLWIPVRRISIEEIHSVAFPIESPRIERISAGIHFIDGATSYHVGPANFSVITTKNKTIRVTTANPAECARALAKVPAAT